MRSFASSGIERFRVAFLLSALASVVVGGVASAQTSELDRLLSSFRGMSGLSAHFVEEKTIALLATPIRSEGEIHFVAPGTLMRRVTSPTASAALIERGRLTMVANGQRQEIDLASNAVVGGFISSFADVLAGDRAALERTYRIAYERTPEGDWKLTLRPKGAPLNQFLTEMEMIGRDRSVRSMRMVEVSGDVTMTTFSDVRLNRRFDDAERRRLFRL
ncbi:MAG: outer membrane lipoprotein carrier protein LolA [Sandaracinus sp.]|nr:outer membrane lipoprotein carrier protein LolA [Sandaracinus sp.]